MADSKDKYTKMLALVRERCPLVHQITNYVTVNDCANITICIGASPVMSHSVQDVAAMVGIADALVLNIGTLDEAQIKGMLAAGTAAAKKGIPIVLDPVGAGATPYRTRTALKLLKELPVAVIKGNAGEIGTLVGMQANVKGVDSAGLAGDTKFAAASLAKAQGAVVVISGPQDIISDGKTTVAVENGAALMGKISGSGCMASAVCGAFVAVCENAFDACVAAMAAVGIAGERAAKAVKAPGSFKPAFLDAVYNLQSLSSAKIKQ